MITCAKFLGHHRTHDVVDIFRMRIAGADVDSFFVYYRIRSMAGLQNVKSSSHISARELEKGLPSVTCEVDTGQRMSTLARVCPSNHAPFCIYYCLNSLLYLRHWQRRESEPGATTLYGWCDLVDIVANDAESNVARILLYHTS